MTFTTDAKPCGCSREQGAPKCADCSPRRRRTADRKAVTHIHVSQIIRKVRERLSEAKG
jgi:hypothetical protein